MLDDYTLRHLDTWLNNNIHDEERDAVREAMVKIASEDPDYWLNQGWWRVYYVTR